MIDPAKLMAWPFPEIRQRYDHKDTILYALGVGLGDPATDPDQLPFVYEDGLRALPTMAVVLGYAGFWLRDPAVGVAWENVLHMREEIALHHPIAPAGEVIGRTLVEHVYDKGIGRGAVLVTRRELFEATTGKPLATMRKHEYCRGEGGFGGEPGPSMARVALPARPPDRLAEHRFPPQAALLYRLSGDDNPLHADPACAVRAGFDRPVLHGLCTLGGIGYCLVRDWCAGDPARLAGLTMNFVAPVYPGEAIRLSSWQMEPGKIVFCADSVERNVRVADSGIARLAGAPGR